MPSEQRLHPATLLFEIGKHLRNFALPAVLILFGASQSSGGSSGRFGRMPSGWEVWLLVLLAPAVLASIARYLSFRLRYERDELVIRSGLIFRNERHIPFSRIQNLDAVQTVLHRAFDVVEVRVETGGGKDVEARLSVLPRAAFDEMRRRVIEGGTAARAEVEPLTKPDAAAAGETLVQLPLRELLLCGFLENRGLVLIGLAYGALWETGILESVAERFFGGAEAFSRSVFRDLFRAFAGGGPLPLGSIALAMGGLAGLLVFVRIVSMIWAVVRLHGFRLVRAGEDLRTTFGSFTRVTATIPIHRVQTIAIRQGPLHRLLKRAALTVETAGGGRSPARAHDREWLAPLIRQQELPALLQALVSDFDLRAVSWQAVHPRAFRRALIPNLVVAAIIVGASALLAGWRGWVLAVPLLAWAGIHARIYVANLAWAESPDVVLMRSGWLWRRITIARVNKIQAVAFRESPFDRRAAMARVRVDTAGATDPSHRVDVPYLDRQVAGDLARRLAAQAATSTFRW
jgi:putative membrane protein